MSTITMAISSTASESMARMSASPASVHPRRRDG
jgi:hypothetical protein